jgi:glycine/D-amino acid oxidase-like deaminating enzyme
VISAIIVTRPLGAGELDAHNWKNEHPTINSRRVLNYFRLLPDNRFLFGGRGYSDGSEAHERRTYARLIVAMRRLWPEWADVPVEYCWHGLICFTASLFPSIGHVDDDASVFFGYGYHGNGVNTATWAGRQLAAWIATGHQPSIPEIVKGQGGRFPLPGLRLKYLQLAIALSSLRDRYA